jgi:hypothetical protein
MARKKMGRPPTSTRDDVTVKIDRDVKATAEYVAARRRVSLAEYLSEAIRVVANKDFERIVKGGAE